MGWDLSARNAREISGHMAQGKRVVRSAKGEEGRNKPHRWLAEMSRHDLLGRNWML